MAPDEIEFHPVTAERWPDLAQLFEESRRTSSGVTPGACWCMVWRQMLVETRRHATPTTKREAYDGTSRLEWWRITLNRSVVRDCSIGCQGV